MENDLAVDFLKVKQAVTDSATQNSTEHLAYLIGRINRYESELMGLRRQVDTLRIVLNRQTAPDSEVIAGIQKTFDNMLNMPQIERISFEDTTLHVFTHTITIRYRRKNYPIGCFDISINFIDGTIEILNTTQRIDNDYDHPHVYQRNGCFGNIYSDVYKYLTTCEFGILIPLLITFLESASTGDWFKHIDAWEIPPPLLDTKGGEEEEDE